MLSRPVNTAIAQVRGHNGYGFPKWLTKLDVEIDTQRTTARVFNAHGGTDLALSVATPRQVAHASGERVSSLTSYTMVDGDWRSTFSQTHAWASGTKRFPRCIELELGSGRMSDDLRLLAPIRAIQLDVTTEGQLALHMPVPPRSRESPDIGGTSGTRAGTCAGMPAEPSGGNYAIFDGARIRSAVGAW